MSQPTLNTISTSIGDAKPTTATIRKKRARVVDTTALRALGVVVNKITTNVLDELEALRKEVGRLQQMETRLKKDIPLLFATCGSCWWLQLEVDRFMKRIAVQVTNNTEKHITFLTFQMWRETDCFNPCTKVSECEYSIHKNELYTMFACLMDAEDVDAQFGTDEEPPDWGTDDEEPDENDA